VDGAHLTTVERGHRLRTEGPARRLLVVLVAALMTATAAVLTAPSAAAAPVPAAPGTVTVAGTITNVTGGTATVDNATPGTTTLAVSGDRTIVDFGSLNLPAGSTLDIVVNSATDIVLLRAGSGAATFAGQLRSYVGSTAGSFGGNVWPFAAGGVGFGSTAQVDVGGLLAFGGTVADADFLAPDLSFALVGATPVGAGRADVNGGQIRGHGSLVGLVGRDVFTGFTSSVGAATGTRTEALFGATRDANLVLDARPGGGGFDVLRFEPSGSNVNRNLALAGEVAAADVFVSSLATTTFVDTVSTYVTKVTATGAPADGDGDVVVAAGGGLARTSGASPMQPVLSTTVPAQLATLGVVRAQRNVVLSTSDWVQLSYGTSLGAPSVAVAARGVVDNLEGSAAIDTASTGQWVVYAPEPADILHRRTTVPTLDSGQRAVWGETYETSPPSSITGNRYVFSDPPDITVTALDTSKNFDTAFAAGQPHPLQATVSGNPHPGVPGVFLGDTLPVFVGGPSLSSDGRPHDAPERPGGYPIVVSAGDFSSPLGYDLVFVNGTLTVDDTSPPVVTPNLTGTLGTNGWYRGTVGLTWSIADPGTVSTSITGVGCGPVSITTDQAATSYTCTGSSLGGDAEPVTVTIKRDASAPVLTIDGITDGETYTPGSWTNDDVSITYTCAGAISGVATMPTNTTATVTGPYGGTCTDDAGNSTTVPFQVNIDRIAPAVTGETFTLKNSGATYTPGAWASEPIEYAWTCTDTGGGAPLTIGGAGGETSSSLTFRGYCADHAGNETYGAESELLVDLADPTIVDPELTSGGDAYTSGDWARGPVTLTWDCADTGGSDPTEDNGTETATTSGTLTATCTDAAGNEVTQDFAVLIDGSAPAIGDVELETADGAAYTSGDWTRQDVVLSWTCTDGAGQSGATKAADSVTATATGTLQATCIDAAGNSVQGETFQARIDRTAPTIVEPTLTSAGVAYTPGTWAFQPVLLTYGCEDAASGPAGMGGIDVPLAQSGTHTATCTDNAGNEASQQFAVLIDGTAPQIGDIRLTTSDGLPYTSGTWTAKTVTLSWTCADGAGGSGATSPTGSATATATGELQARCTDVAGNTARGEQFQANIDTVAPVLAGVPADRSVQTSGTTAVVTWTDPTATDDEGTASPVTCTPGSGTAFPIGTTTVTCRSTDAAGNVGTATFTVTVTGTAVQPPKVTFTSPIDGLPVLNLTRWGRTVPIRAELTVNGQTITRSTPQPLYVGPVTRVSCQTARSVDAVETYTSSRPWAGNLLHWDYRTNRWVFHLDPARVGMKVNTCYRVDVFYGGRVRNGVGAGGALAGSFLVMPIR
jgi:hypothetical protein